MRKLFRSLSLIAALAITAVGAMLGFLSIAMALVSSGPDTLSFVTLGASLSILSLTLGSASAWHAWQAIRGTSSTPFRPKRIWLLAVLYLLTLVLGQAMLSASLLSSLVFPLLHAAAAALPALFILTLMGRTLGGATVWRDMILQTASGAFLATPLAFIVEMATILLIAVATFLGLASQPGGQDLMLRVTPYLHDGTLLLDSRALVSTALSPVVIVGAFALMAGIVPIIEESVKTIGVAILAYRQPSLPQAILWGATAGAGFAITEGMLNAAVDLGTWLPVVVVRIGATLLHCTTGALMGLAWHQMLGRHRWSRGLALYVLSVTVHGLWNGLALAMTLLSLRELESEAIAADHMITSLGTLGILSLLGILTLVMAVGLAGLTLYARRQAQASVAVTGQLRTAPWETPASADASAPD